MNRERIKGLITQIGKVPRSKFNMSNWIAGVIGRNKGREAATGNEKHTCGTSACIAGWTVLLYSDSPTSGVGVATEAARLLELPETKANALFYGYMSNGGQVELSKITQKQAVTTLERLLATGDVRWDLRDTPVT